MIAKLICLSYTEFSKGANSPCEYLILTFDLLRYIQYIAEATVSPHGRFFYLKGGYNEYYQDNHGKCWDFSIITCVRRGIYWNDTSKCWHVECDC